MLSLLHLGLEVITEVGTDPTEKFVSFKFTLCNDRVVCVYAPSGYSTREQLAKRRFFEGIQNDMENENKGNENKIILGDFDCTMDKMDRDGENKIVAILPSQNSLWAMGLRIYGEGRIRFPWVYPLR